MTVARYGLLLAALVAGAAVTQADPISSKDAPSKPTLYVVGYSHLDTQWCWTYPQVINEFIPNTLHDNFALFEKYPDYVFNWTGSNRYRFIKDYYPQDFLKLKDYVRQGKWFPAGSSVEEGDVNSPSEESLIRQVMYGNQFFRREFGVQSDEYMLPDCFGFPASLPSILAHCGIKGFSTQKLTWGSAVGIPFNVGNWVGPDGHSIVAALNATSYGSDIKNDLTQDPDWTKRLKEDVTKTGVGVDYRYYGTGDQGGAPDEKSVQQLEASLHPGGQIAISAGRADQMFKDLTAADRAQLPNYQGDLELTGHSAGSISSQAAMKRWNRKNELLANAAESSSVIADYYGGAKYDKARITDAWLRFLPGQFHDLMAGTALPLAYTYTWNDEILAMNEFSSVLTNSAGAAARQLNTEGSNHNVVVYNPLSVDRNDIVTAKVALGDTKLAWVHTPEGQTAPFQIEGTDNLNLTTIVFRAQVPSLGYQVYQFDDASKPGANVVDENTPNSLKVDLSGLENSRYKVTINGNGDIASVFDKQLQKELLSAPARLVYQHENPVQWPAWNMDWEDQKQPPADWVQARPELKIVEQGPVRVALQVTRHYKGSQFVQTLKLGTGDAADRLDVDTMIDWQGQATALKAEFPMTASNPKATYTWGLGTVQRGNNDPTKFEVASHGWIDVTDAAGGYGSSVLDDCKYASDKPSDNLVRLTLLYTPGTHGPGYAHQGTQDWGEHHMTYAFMGHAQSWQQGDTQWQASELNQPLLAFQVPDQHKGSGQSTLSLAHTSDKNVSIEAAKQAEDSQEVVIRLNELSGQNHPGSIVSFGTAHSPMTIVKAREIDGQEREIGPANVANGNLVVDVHPYEPRAFALTLAPAQTTYQTPTSTPVTLPYDIQGITNRTYAGNFDGNNNSLPGEVMPDTIQYNGISFKTGPRTENNVMTGKGQTVLLPAGTHRKLYILGSSLGQDNGNGWSISGNQGSGATAVSFPTWNGYIGQWDTRSWEGKVESMTWDWHNPIAGLKPGYIKRDNVAWYADHIHDAKGNNLPYQFCYLFVKTIDVSDDMTSVTIPQDNNLRIVAMTVTDDPNGGIEPAQPLYDTLEHTDQLDGPYISAVATKPDGPHTVTILHPLYWSKDNPVRYTLDGSDPTPNSPAYTRPFAIGKSCMVKAAQFEGRTGRALQSSVSFIVNDVSAPKITAVFKVPGTHDLKVWFDEELDKTTAENPDNYGIYGVTIKSAKLSPLGNMVVLAYEGQILPSRDLLINHVADIGGNAATQSMPVLELVPVSSFDGSLDFDGARNQTKKAKVPTVVAKADSPWTINMWVFMAQQPEELTLVGGFGDGGDNQGAERFVINHMNQIGFWGSDIDIYTATPFDIGKWQMVTATYDGSTVRIYKDGKEIGSQKVVLADASPQALLGPRPAWQYGHMFKGRIASFTVWSEALPPAYIRSTLLGEKPR